MYVHSQNLEMLMKMTDEKKTNVVPWLMQITSTDLRFSWESNYRSVSQKSQSKEFHYSPNKSSPPDHKLS